METPFSPLVMRRIAQLCRRVAFVAGILGPLGVGVYVYAQVSAFTRSFDLLVRANILALTITTAAGLTLIYLTLVVYWVVALFGVSAILNRLSQQGEMSADASSVIELIELCLPLYIQRAFHGTGYTAEVVEKPVSL